MINLKLSRQTKLMVGFGQIKSKLVNNLSCNGPLFKEFELTNQALYAAQTIMACLVAPYLGFR